MILCSNPLAQYLALKDDIDTAIETALANGKYILGDEVQAFEQEFAAYCGARHCIGVANGTEALQLALMALDIGPGDEVITVSHTATATVAAIVATGATPVYADIDERSFNIDPDGIESLITDRTRAIVPVHLYGQAAEMNAILALAHRHKLFVVEDSAQAAGAELDGSMVGSLGNAASFSFYPTKNLGAIGDGGAVLTNDDGLADEIRSLRQYGWKQRFSSARHGINSRLDELQAAILRVKLAHLDAFNASRRELADLYETGLQHGQLPIELANNKHVYHLYVIRSQFRDELLDYLHKKEIAAGIHYPLPVHKQAAYADNKQSLPVTEKIVSEILSLPMYPELGDDIVNVINAVNTFSEQVVPQLEAG